MQKVPRAALFDLDETLAESFMSPLPHMIQRIHAVLEHIPCAIVTGRDFAWMEKDFLAQITVSPHSNRFYVVAEGGAEGYSYRERAWHKEYGTKMSSEEREQIRTTIAEAVQSTQALLGETIYGEQFIDKHSMVAFAMIGRDVPTQLKKTWDPGNAKRHLLANVVAEKLPQYDVVLGGATTLDVTMHKINKAYGVQWLSKTLNIPVSEMFYVGDALYPDGNDEPVIATGIQVRGTSGPTETEKIIDDLLTTLTKVSP